MPKNYFMSTIELAQQVQAVFTAYEAKQNERRMLTSLQVQQLLDVSAQTLWLWQCSGKLVAINRVDAGKGVSRLYKYSDVVACKMKRKYKKGVSNV